MRTVMVQHVTNGGCQNSMMAVTYADRLVTVGVCILRRVVAVVLACAGVAALVAGCSNGSLPRDKGYFESLTGPVPTAIGLHYNRGVELGNEEHYEEAIEQYTAAIQLRPDYLEAYFNRGVMRSELGQRHEAIKDFSQAIRVDSEYVPAYIRRGMERQAIGDIEGAISDFTQAIERNPQDARGFANRGLAYLRTGKDAESQKDLHRALKLDANLKADLEEIATIILQNRAKAQPDEQ